MNNLPKCFLVWLSLISFVLVATSCAAGSPTATLTIAPPTATPTSEVVATPTPIPTEAPTATPTPEVVGTPTMSPDDVPRISLEELRQLMDSGADIVIVDNQPRSVYEQGHVKGAISLPWAMEIDPEKVMELPWDKPIITYCDCGPGEADSADVARQLLGIGFSDVKTLAGGWSEWKAAGYPIEEGE